MEEFVLVVQVYEVTEKVYNFNEYMYRLVKCKAETDEPFDTLIPIETGVSVGDVISIEKCKLVRIDYEEKHIATAVRVDKMESCEEGTKLSKYFNIPFIGLIKRHADSKVTVYGPDKMKFFKVKLQMRDLNRKPFTVTLLGFNGKATLLNSFDKDKEIIMGIATLKHRSNNLGYELALVNATEYNA